MALTLLPVSAMAEGGEGTAAPTGETVTEAAEAKVAQIGDVKYDTLAEAVEKAATGATIVLLNDVALDNTLTLNKNLILDLNGHVISNGNSLGTNYLVKVAYGAEVSIIGNKENSSINDTRTNPTGTITAICVFGNLTVDGAELTISRGLNGIAIKVDESGADKLGKLTVKSGKVSSTQAIQNWGITTIDGGTFTGDVGSHAYSNIGGEMTINDGIFNGPVYSAQLKYGAWPTAQAKTTIVNGAFNDVVAEYYDDGTNGLQPVERSDKPDGDVNCKVAITGGTFSNLSCVKYMTADSKVTVDLNGKTVNGSADFYAGDLTIKNGTVAGIVYVNASETDAKYNHLTVAADATINGVGGYAIDLFEAKKGQNNFGSTIDVYGKLNGNIFVLGNIKTDLTTAKSPCVINVHDGAVIDGGTSSDPAESTVGIALNGAAILNVGKATITGDTGIEVRAGRLTVDGATVTGTATPTEVKPNGSGTTTNGAGIGIAQHTTKLPIEVTINSGAISGYTAFYESNPQNNAAEDLAKINIAVKGGEFKAINGGTNTVYSEDKTGFITGGYFTSDPTAYLAAGKYVIKSDKAGYTYAVTGTKPEKTPIFVDENTTYDTSAITDETTKNAINAVINKAKVEGVAAAVDESALVASKVDASEVDAAKKVDVEVSVKVEVKSADLSGENAAKTLTFEAKPVATIKVDGAVKATDVPVPNSLLSGEITVKLPLPTGFTPKQILHKFTGGGYEYFINKDEGGKRGAGSFEIKDGCAVFTIYGFSTFELSGTVTYVEPSSSSGSSSSSRRYDVSAPSVKHGDVTVSPKTASKGDTVTITVKPDSGYELDTLTVKDASGSKIKVKDKGDGKFTFTMPASKVTVSAEFAEIETLDFADVPTDAYYYEAVKWAAKKGITGGTGDGTFNPNGSCTRAHIVTFLWRAAGSPEPKSTVSFADVPAGSYYAKAVAWAVENGITLGTGDGTFSPNATCTRAQSVTFLYRALGTAPTTVNGFTDVAADAFYADAVAWAVESGVTNGTSASTFSPNNGCTRAQIVTFLYRTMK